MKFISGCFAALNSGLGLYFGFGIEAIPAFNLSVAVLLFYVGVAQ